MVIDREQCAWLAGIFDGEGCIRSARDRDYPEHPYPRCYITQCSPNGVPEILSRAKSIIGGGRIHRSGNTKKGTPIYQFAVCHFEFVQHAVCLAWSWLSDIKKQDAARALLLHRVTRA